MLDFSAGVILKRRQTFRRQVYIVFGRNFYWTGSKEVVLGVLWLFRSQLHSKTCFAPENCVLPRRNEYFFARKACPSVMLLRDGIKWPRDAVLRFFAVAIWSERQILRRQSYTFGQFVRFNTNQCAEEGANIIRFVSAGQVKRGQNNSAVRNTGAAPAPPHKRMTAKNTAPTVKARVRHCSLHFFFE